MVWSPWDANQYSSKCTLILRVIVDMISEIVSNHSYPLLKANFLITSLKESNVVP